MGRELGLDHNFIIQGVYQDSFLFMVSEILLYFV